MHEKIILALKEVEKMNNCKILFACESGSRAWGFSSCDSDYDIRFIYVNMLNWYLSLDEKSDSITLMLPDELDLSGWDLRKSLQLFVKCNLCLNEWLGSPIVYYKNNNFFDAIYPLIPYYFNAKKALHHYLSTAENIIEKFLVQDQLSIKRLFYIIRSILACLWILNYETMPPTYFIELLNKKFMPDALYEIILSLLEEKYFLTEKTTKVIPQSLYSWIEVQIEKIRTASKIITNKSSSDITKLNTIMTDFASETVRS